MPPFHTEWFHNSMGMCERTKSTNNGHPTGNTIGRNFAPSFNLIMLERVRPYTITPVGEAITNTLK